ncbi:Serine carboxypeptidase-like protein [Hordeum vulgare]|nr:Serine carboxypeptidase-like protein [Hordeum vulgare]
MPPVRWDAHGRTGWAPSGGACGGGSGQELGQAGVDLSRRRLAACCSLWIRSRPKGVRRRHGDFIGQRSFSCRLFYFFESRRHKEDPVLIWLTGGRGCSSELALFYENGPFHIADDMSLLWNEFG